MGLGCWAVGGPFWEGDNPLGWGEVDDNESIAAIHRALDLGITFLDTADIYGAGRSERVLARALEGRRNDVILATKFGILFDEDSKQVSGTDGSAAYIRRACEASLRRLETDYIDLYQFHLNDYDVDRAPEAWEALEKLVEEGKIRYYGWSTDFPERAQEFAKGPNCTSAQYEMNVLIDAPGMVETTEELNLAGIIRGPLAMGLLTGKYKAAGGIGEADVRGQNSPDWMRYFKDGVPNAEWLGQLEAVREILTSGGRTLVQGALAWLWARSDNTIPIPGARTVAQVEENCGAMAFGPLARDAMAEIEGILGRS
jgi:aryl-alcohol dehydrogenase-like predicted oxidoreductase